MSPCDITIITNKIQYANGKVIKMKKYSNLDVIIDEGIEKNEVRYNFDTGIATVYARSEEDAERGIEILNEKGMLIP